MKIVIASGKGGTGKTTIAVNLAIYIANTIKQTVNLLDCDVEAPNDHLFIKPHYFKEYPVTVTRPYINQERCTGCGKCVAICNYNVFAKVNNEILLFPEFCHSCGACSYFCPNQALLSNEVAVGSIKLAKQNNLTFIEGRLNIGEVVAPSIIRAVKQHCVDTSFNIIDAAPGTACTVVAAMQDADLVILVTEETVFGLHDLRLAVNLAAKLKLPVGVIINRALNNSELITNFCKQANIPIIEKIPLQAQYATSYAQGALLLEQFPEVANYFAHIWQYIIKARKTIPAVIATKPLGNEVIATMAAKSLANDAATAKAKKTVTIASANSQVINKPIEIAIVSGKGGTGKTTIASAMVELMAQQTITIVDTDVDAANLALLLEPVLMTSEPFVGGVKYFIKQELCLACGLCEQYCQVNAIKNSVDHGVTIDEFTCEGCGFCAKICPANAIVEQASVTGEIYGSTTKYGILTHAELAVGAENSGKLVAKVREQATKTAQQNTSDYVINDGPPGIGCPVVSAITGADVVLIVAEPTVAGVHDLTRILQLTQHFKIFTLVIINKVDLNIECAKQIVDIAKQYDRQIIGEIPYDLAVITALMQGKSIIQYGKGAAFTAINELWDKLLLQLGQVKKDKVAC